MFEQTMGGLPGTRQQLGGAGVLRREGRASAARSTLERCWQAMLRTSVALLAFVAVPVLSAGLNDTGITACSNNDAVAASCSVALDGQPNPRQDAIIGRDAQASAGALAKTGAGSKGFDYSKLDSNGNVLSAGTDAPTWVCTKDNVSGLVWEVKATVGARDYHNTYSWYQNGVGVQNGGACNMAGRCDTAKFAADVNATNLCGFNDWRLPTVKELEGLIDFGHPSPPIDPIYFPNTPLDTFWSSTVDAAAPNANAWFVSFISGSIARPQFKDPNRVRLVRGAANPSQFVLTDDGTTVTDNSTGLMWKRDYETALPGPNSSTIADHFVWSTALRRAASSTFANHTDWRLPNIKELRSLYDQLYAMPAIDTSFFPATPSAAWFWSSSPYLDNLNHYTYLSWVIGADNGGDQPNPRSYAQYVRLVRDGAFAAPTLPTLPGAPNIGTATPGSGSASIAFTAPSPNGSVDAIDSYLASCSANGGTPLTQAASSSSLPIIVTGLTNGLTYGCTVKAHNVKGYGAASFTAYVVPVAAPCSYALNKSTDSSSASAFIGNVIVTAAANCAPTAQSTAIWLTAGAVSAGTGTFSVAFSVAANPDPTARIGMLTISGQTFTFTQAGNCSYTLGASSASVGAAGGPGTFSVTTSSSCGWNVAITDGSDSWITVTLPKAVSLNPVVTSTGSYGVNQNPTMTTRSGTLMIAGLPFAVTQEAAATSLVPVCTLSASASPISAGATSTLTASCSPAADSYVWSDAGCSSTAPSCVVTPSTTSVYSVAGKAFGVAGSAGSATVTVSAADQTIGLISFSPTTVTVGGTSVASASASSGLAVTFTSATTGICSVSGSTVTGVAEGTCTIAADQVGDSTHNPAPQVTNSVLVSPQTSRLFNVSTRGQVQSGNNVMIGGFTIGGSTPKKVLIRGIGPSLSNAGIAGALVNPMLQLFSGPTQIAINDDWVSATNQAEIQASGLAPLNVKESAILVTLNPGAYTAIVSGVNNGTGVGMVEVFELDHPETPLTNISTRGLIQTGSNVSIGGFIIQGTSAKTVLIRAGGPSLSNFGVTGVLANPKLDLYSGPNVIDSNDDWGTSTNATAIQATGLAPVNPQESAILITLQPGAYTAVVSGVSGGTGVGIVEIFAQ